MAVVGKQERCDLGIWFYCVVIHKTQIIPHSDLN